MRVQELSCFRFFVAAILIFIPAGVGAQGNGLVASDYQKLRSVGQAEISPDGKLIAYTIGEGMTGRGVRGDNCG